MTPINVTSRWAKYRFPVIFSSAVVGMCIAFANRQYFLQGIEEEAKRIYKDDPETRRMFEEFKKEYNRTH